MQVAGVLLDLVGQRRTRPHQRHRAHQHVDQLGQLVERQPAQHPAHAGHPRVDVHLEQQPVAVAGAAQTSCSRSSASTYIVRNFRHWKWRPLRPTRVCRNSTGPGLSRLIEHRDRQQHRQRAATSAIAGERRARDALEQPLRPGELGLAQREERQPRQRAYVDAVAVEVVEVRRHHDLDVAVLELPHQPPDPHARRRRRSRRSPGSGSRAGRGCRARRCCGPRPGSRAPPPVVERRDAGRRRGRPGGGRRSGRRPARRTRPRSRARRSAAPARPRPARPGRPSARRTRCAPAWRARCGARSSARRPGRRARRRRGAGSSRAARWST